MPVTKKWSNGLLQKSRSSLQRCPIALRLTTTTNFCRKLSEAEEGTDNSWHTLACIFCGEPSKQGVAKTATEENLAQEGEDSDSNQAWFEPALLQSGSSSQDARWGLKSTARPHCREHFPLSVRAVPGIREHNTILQWCERGMEVPWASSRLFCLVSLKGKGEVARQCYKGCLCHFLEETLWEVIKCPLLAIVWNRKNTCVKTKPVTNRGRKGAENQLDFWDPVQF